MKLSKDKSKIVTDEKINTITHMIAAIFAVLGSTLLIVKSSIMGDPWKIVGFSIYSFTLISLFVVSSLHHGYKSTKKVNNIFRKLDYTAVFLLIVGTMVPIYLTVMRNYVGWSIFGVSIAVCIFGIIMTNIGNIKKWINLSIYLALGWFGAIIVLFAYSLIPIQAIILLGIGGIAYTVGAIIFLVEKPNLIPGKFCFHELWHILVIIGALLHWIMMYLYILYL